ncbi:MAG: CvpA family protein [Pseudomonadota bacterium]
MGAVDWVLLAVLAASMLLGAWRGLVYELLSLLSWVAAFFLAQWFAPAAAAYLPMAGAAEPVRYAAGFVLVFIAAAFAGGLLAWLIKKLVEMLGMRPVDRTLGAAFGLLRGGVLLLAVAVVMAMTPLHTSVWWRQSGGARLLEAALAGLKPVLPEAFGRHLPS